MVSSLQKPIPNDESATTCNRMVTPFSLLFFRGLDINGNRIRTALQRNDESFSGRDLRQILFRICDLIVQNRSPDKCELTDGQKYERMYINYLNTLSYTINPSSNDFSEIVRNFPDRNSDTKKSCHSWSWSVGSSVIFFLRLELVSRNALR